MALLFSGMFLGLTVYYQHITSTQTYISEYGHALMTMVNHGSYGWFCFIACQVQNQYLY